MAVSIKSIACNGKNGNETLYGNSLLSGPRSIQLKAIKATKTIKTDKIDKVSKNKFKQKK